MTPSNTDLARECGGIWRAGDDRPSLMCFTLTKLDAFAERIRADEHATLAAHLPPDKWAELRERERITRTSMPHRNSTMRGTYSGKELEYRGREVS